MVIIVSDGEWELNPNVTRYTTAVVKVAAIIQDELYFRDWYLVQTFLHKN